MTVEAALITLGTAAVRTATKLWLGDHEVAAEVGASAVDQLSLRLSTHRDKRKLNRLIENFAESVVDRLDPILEQEFRTLPENERLAAIEAVRDTFDSAVFVDTELFAADLDAGHLDKSVRLHAPDPSRLLSADATSLYDLLLRECCGYIIEISRGLPRFSTSALIELLRRDTQILEEIREVLARLPQRDRGDGFEYDYRQLVARKLDQVEIFGVTLADDTRRYPLSVAYISLTASTSDETSSATSRVEDLLSGRRRLFIRGEAGLGKTTLLQWIAVRSARGDFTGPLTDWNRTVPFLLPLRRYADGPLPAPERFMDEVGRHIAGQMPTGWIHDQLRSGRAIVLVDGVDELPADRRDEARAWLADLVTAFPLARFVVTSRPGATGSNWLRQADFSVLDLEQMSQADVRTFVRRWHDAIRSLCVDDASRAEIDAYEAGLVQHLNTSSHLRKLAGYPLLCALLSALYKDRRAALPTNRLELYDVALQMLLERRDAERRIATPKGLDRTEKILLLGDLAYWLIRNNRTDIETARAVTQLSQRLTLMPQVQVEPATVYRHLLERSGLLRESVTGRMDFIHRTFQEYLAARTAIRNADDVGQLVANAHLDQWHEVVIMSAGHATFTQREELLDGLLTRAGADPEHDALALLAVACLETTPELSADLRRRIERRVESLLPPESLSAAKAFGSAGEFVLDLLARAEPRTTKETVATIRALAETVLGAAIPLLARYCADERGEVQEELIRSSARFDSETYGALVLSQTPALDVVEFDSDVKTSALRYLPLATDLTVVLSPHHSFYLGVLPPHVEVVRIRGTESECATGLNRTHELPNLRHVEIDGAAVRGIERFRQLPALRSLGISYGVTVSQLETIPPGWGLEELSLTYVRDLVDLTALGFLDQLNVLKLDDCPRLRRLDGIERWSDHLTELALRNGRGIDFTAIRGAKNLRHLDLTGTRVPDVTVLFGLTQLRTLRLTTANPEDVPTLERELPGLTVTQLPPSHTYWSA